MATAGPATPLLSIRDLLALAPTRLFAGVADPFEFGQRKGAA